MPRKGQKGLPLPQEHKNAISEGLKRYYAIHDGPWKGVKRNKEFKNTVSKTLKRKYKNKEAYPLIKEYHHIPTQRKKRYQSHLKNIGAVTRKNHSQRQHAIRYLNH